MGGIFEGLKAWQMAVVVLLLGGIGGGVYGGYAAVTGSDETAVEAGETSIPVQRGDLILQVSTDGSITFPLTETVVSELQGTIGEVLVEEGAVVAAGDVIARLSDRDVAGLESALADARIDVAEARDALADELDPVDPLAVAEAQARVSDSRQSLEAAIDALADLQDTSEAELAAARLAVAEADVRMADARERLEEMIAQPDEDAVADARTALRLAEETLANEISQAARDEETRSEAAADAAIALEDAASEYDDLFGLWLGVKPSDLTDTDPKAVLSAMVADLAVLFDPSGASAQLGFEQAANGRPENDPDTAWDEQVVFTWLSLYPGDVAVSVGEGDPVAGTRYVRDELDGAWDAVQAAAGAVDDLAVADAVARTAADTKAERARDAVEAAATALADLFVAAESVEVAAQVQRVASAELEALEDRESLDQLLAGPNELEVERAADDIEVAREVLASAQDALAETQAGPDPDRVALREAQLAAAILGVDAAQEDLASATLTAPSVGVVTSLLAEAGDSINRGGSVAVVVDQSVVEVLGSVDELDVLSLTEGAAATVVLDALGGQALPGIVSFVAAESEGGQVVTYEFRVTVEAPQGVALLEGLTATATVVTSQQSGVLLVPNAAIGGSVIQPTVRVDSGGGVEEREVTLGQSDGFWTAVLLGLSEGESVVMETSSSTQQAEQGFQSLRGLAGVGGGNFVGGGGQGGGRGQGGGGQ